MLDALIQSARSGDVAAVRHDLRPLSEADRRQLAPKALKLMQEVRQAWRSNLSVMAGRRVNFMIYRSIQDALGRGPSIKVP